MPCESQASEAVALSTSQEGASHTAAISCNLPDTTYVNSSLTDATFWCVVEISLKIAKTSTSRSTEKGFWSVQRLVREEPLLVSLRKHHNASKTVYRGGIDNPYTVINHSRPALRQLGVYHINITSCHVITAGIGDDTFDAVAG